MERVYVLGGEQTDFERNWTKEGKNVVALLKEVVGDALKATSITYEDIKKLNKQNRVAVFIGNFCAEFYINQGHLGPLLTEVNEAFYGVPSARYEAACASGSVALDAAITKIKSGDYDLAIVIGFELMKTVNSKICGDYLGLASFYEREAKDIEFPFPKLFGKLADEIYKKYNLDIERFNDNLAQISCINYNNAKLNPKAQTRKWFMDKRQALYRGNKTNEYIGNMLALSDCSQVTDGAAVVMLGNKKICNQLKKRLNIENFMI